MLYAYINANGLLSLTRDVQLYMQPDCLENQTIRKALEEVEEVYKIEGLAMYSKRHGVKSPGSLSLGVKALIMAYYQDKGIYKTLFSSACMGDNIGKYIQEMSLTMDMHIAWDSYLPMDWDAPILAKDMATGEVITTVRRFQDIVGHNGGEPSVPKVPFGGF